MFRYSRARTRQARRICRRNSRRHRQEQAGHQSVRQARPRCLPGGARYDPQYLSCHTQQAIAEAVGVSQKSVDRQIDDFSQNSKYSDLTIFRDFDGDENHRQIYTIWNFSKANRGSSLSILRNSISQKFAFSRRSLKLASDLFSSAATRAVTCSGIPLEAMS